MNSNTLLIALFFFHWIADFIMQDDNTAKNKSTDIFALLYHCTVYSLSMMVMIIILPFSNATLNNVFNFVLINGVSHLSIDFVTSKLTTHLYKIGDRHHFFCVIGLDQFLHTTILVLTSYILL